MREPPLTLPSPAPPPSDFAVSFPPAVPALFLCGIWVIEVASITPPSSIIDFSCSSVPRVAHGSSIASLFLQFSKAHALFWTSDILCQLLAF